MAVSLNGDGTITGLSTLDSVTITGLTSLTTTDLTADTTTLVVDSANDRVGIGTSSPDSKLHVSYGSIISNALAQGKALTIESDGDGAVNVITPNTNTGYINFGDPEDSNSGRIWYNHPSNFMAFGINGSTERMRIDSSGNVGIGTSSPNSKLDVTGYIRSSSSTVGGVVYVGNNLNGFLGTFRAAHNSATVAVNNNAGNFPVSLQQGGVDRLFINTSGNVGIGTTSPRTVGTYKTVAIGGVLSGGIIDMVNDSNQILASVYSNGTGTLELNADPDGVRSSSTMTFAVDGTERMRITSAGLVGIGTSSPSDKLTVNGGNTSLHSGSWLRFGSNNVLWGDASFGTILQAYPTADFIAFRNSSGTERMRITSTGNVGIGTSSPGEELDIVGSDSTVANFSQAALSNDGIGTRIWNQNATTGTIANLSFRNRTSNAQIAGIASQLNSVSTYSPDLIFWQRTAYAGCTERMRIDSSGRVGIGTSSASATLHVKSPTTTSSGVFASIVEQAKTDNGSATTGLQVKYTNVSPGDSNHIFQCVDSGGTVRFFVQNNGGTGGTSDRTLKENIVDATDKLADLRKLKVRNYNWIEHGPEGGFKELGFIAQEVEDVFPKLVKENPETGKKMLLDSVFVPILVKALQEASDKIDALETRIQALENPS